MQVKLVLACALACLALPAFGQLRSANGIATVKYDKRATPAVKEQAFHDAEVDAIKSYFDAAGPAQADIFDAIRSKVTASIDDYFLHAVRISEEDHPDIHQYTVNVRGDINVARLEKEKKTVSAVGTALDQQKSLLTFVFVARAKNSVTSLGPQTVTEEGRTVARGVDTDSAKRGTQVESIGAHEISTGVSKHGHSSSVSSTSTVSSSGQKSRMSIDEYTWMIIPSADLSSIITGVFSAAGYRVREADYVTPEESKNLFSVPALQNDYKTGMDLQPKTKLNTLKGLQAANIPYLALATLDVGFPDIDPKTGDKRVYVTVNAEFVNVVDRSTVAKVGPEQFAGLGATDDVARTNALKLAADKAAHELLDRVNVTHVH
jgi:hypothetical protein